MMNESLAVLEPYCENEMKRLKGISKSIFMRFNEPLTKADYDDFFSLANMTLWQAYNSYDPGMGIDFDVFLRVCLKKKFSTEIRNRHRAKRIINRFSVSLDTANENNEECNLLELIPSDFDTFEEVMKIQGDKQYQGKAERYISRLSNQQVNILNLLMDGYKPGEIQRALGISSKEYADDIQIMRSYENARILL